MSISRADENDLLLPLHAGPQEDAPFATFLARLRRRLRAEAAMLLLAEPGSAEDDVRLLSSGVSDIADPARGLAPHVRRQLRPGRAYRTGDIDAPIEGEICAVRADDPSGALSAWMLVSRARGAFSAGDGALLAALAPHLAVALRTHAALSRHRLRDAAASRTLGRLGTGWLLLDADLRVLDADPVADAMLRAARGMPAAIGERIAAGDESLRLLAALVRDPAGGPRLVALGEPPAPHMVARRFPERPATLIGHLRRAPDAGPDRATALAMLYGLSPGEARLALALVDGRSLVEAAATLRLTVETVRNYSKRLYAKTGTRGQADLVRLVLCGVAMLA